jgi:UDP:flavonoid glycosyltransferase YjiC (YdhE family)
VLICDPLKLVQPYHLLSKYYVSGACFWEPEIKMPEKLKVLEDILYISLGSTGSSKVPVNIIDKICRECEIKDVVWVNANKPEITTSSVSIKHHYFDWLPANEILKRTKLVISQGGSGSTYQALAHGVPCAIWASHLNQKILGEVIQESGSGVLLNANDSSVDYLTSNFQSLHAKADCFNEPIGTIKGPVIAANRILEFLMNS